MPNDGDRSDSAQFPPPAALLRAFHTPEDPRAGGHRVLDAAGRLARCHLHRRRAVKAALSPDAPADRVAACGRVIADIDGSRAGLVAHIDEWVAANIAHRAGASLHTETLGAVIDRMAEKWVAAQHALGGDQDTQTTTPLQWEARTHLQWCRLAELTDGYRDLVTDVVEQRRRLPVW
ncbi:DUF4254 domain-containing protein [Nocardia thailandica]